MYKNKYFDKCLLIFKTNIPVFFDPQEEELFRHYLLQESINYYILFNKKNRLVAAGGYGYNKTTKSVDLTWGLVNFKLHNKGFGTALMNYRLNQINREFQNIRITLNTSQKTFEFYEKFGFQTQKITKNYYGIGLDRYDMLKSD